MRIEIFFAADKNIYIIKSRNIIPETIAAKIHISHRQFVMLDYPSENSRNEDTCTRQRTRVTYVLDVEIRTKGCMTNNRRFISILSSLITNKRTFILKKYLQCRRSIPFKINQLIKIDSSTNDVEIHQSGTWRFCSTICCNVMHFISNLSIVN